jgi:hypothetical protein
MRVNKSIFEDATAITDEAKQLVSKAEFLVLSEDVRIISDFRDDINEFIENVRHSKPFVEIDKLEMSQKFELRSIYDRLRQFELELAMKLVQLRRDKATLRRMEEAAFPSDTSMGERDYSKWGIWPLNYSERTKAKLATARLPE